MATIVHTIESQAAIDAATTTFASAMRGRLITPPDAGYDETRSIYNAMHNYHPLLIAQPVDAGDVATAVSYARDRGLPLAVKGGGHNVAGFGSIDGGLVIDLSAMRSVEVDAGARTATVGGGATWADVDNATHAYGLATPSGIISSTGVGGLTLGGGFGYLSRRFGLSCDNLVSAEVVTANGNVVRASDHENSDLFWAIRGGGGNFGVVTEFTFRLHQVANVYGGPIFFPAEASAEVLAFFRDFIATAPRELSAFFGYHEAPPAPFVPEHLHGHKACVIVACYTGPIEQAEAAIQPIRNAGPVALDLCGPIPYPALNSIFDSLLPKGLHHYWKADFVEALSDEAIGVHADFGPRVPNFLSLMHLYPMDGAIHDAPSDATAFSYRDARFIHIIAGIDANPANMQAHKGWVREYWSALHPMSAKGAYVNFLMDEGQDRIRATYRENYPRLVETKSQWDPTNLFRLNQNIRPAQ